MTFLKIKINRSNRNQTSSYQNLEIVEILKRANICSNQYWLVLLRKWPQERIEKKTSGSKSKWIIEEKNEKMRQTEPGISSTTKISGHAWVWASKRNRQRRLSWVFFDLLSLYSLHLMVDAFVGTIYPTLVHYCLSFTHTHPTCLSSMPLLYFWVYACLF